MTEDDLRSLWSSMSIKEREAFQADAEYWSAEWDADWFDAAVLRRMAAACLNAADTWDWRDTGPEGAQRTAAAFIARCDVLLAV